MTTWSREPCEVEEGGAVSEGWTIRYYWVGSKGVGRDVDGARGDGSITCYIAIDPCDPCSSPSGGMQENMTKHTSS